MNRDISIVKDTKIFYKNDKQPKLIMFLATLLLLIIIILLSMQWDWFLIFLALAVLVVFIRSINYKKVSQPSLVLSSDGFQYHNINYSWDDVENIEIGTDTQEIVVGAIKPIYLIIDLRPLHHLSPKEQLEKMEQRGNKNRLTIGNGDADDYKLRELYDLFMKYWQPDHQIREYPEQIDIQYNKYFMTSQSKIFRALSWLTALITLSLFIAIASSFFTQHEGFGIKFYGILISLVGFIFSVRFIYANISFYQSSLMSFNSAGILYYLPLDISKTIRWSEIETITLMRKTGWIFSQPYLCIYLKNEEEFIQKLSFLNRLKARYFQYKKLSPIHIHNDLKDYYLEQVYQQMMLQWQNSQ